MKNLLLLISLLITGNCFGQIIQYTYTDTVKGKHTIAYVNVPGDSLRYDTAYSIVLATTGQFTQTSKTIYLIVSTPKPTYFKSSSTSKPYDDSQFMMEMDSLRILNGYK